MSAKSLYISSTQSQAGSLVVIIGLMQILRCSIQKVAFFRPVIESLNKKDSDIEFVLSYYGLEQDYDSAYGAEIDHVESMIAQGKSSELLENMVLKFKKLQKEYDFILIEGMAKDHFSMVISNDLNIQLAKNFSSPFINVLKAKNRTTDEIIDEINLEYRILKKEGCINFCTFVNRLDLKTKSELHLKLVHHEDPIFLLEEIIELDLVTVREVKDHLNATELVVNNDNLKRSVSRVKIAAASCDTFLEYLEEGDLIIVPGDRSDMLLAILGAYYAKNYPSVCGIVITLGMKPHKNIMKLIDGIEMLKTPILLVDNDTYECAQEIAKIKTKIRKISKRKIALAEGLFNSNIESNFFEEKIYTTSSNVVTPMMFEFSLFDRARSNKKRIVLDESLDDRILMACEILLRRDIVEIILLGKSESINQRASQLGVDISKATIIDPQTSLLQDIFIYTLYELRKAKGLTKQGARDAISYSEYFATMMVHLDYADGMVSGATHTTANTIRPALQIIKTKENISTVSSIFFMCMDLEVLVFGDCAIVQDPTSSQLAEIAISSAQSAESFGLSPKVALLSYSTGESGSGKDVEKVKEALVIAKKLNNTLLIEGPLQYDAAVDADVAKKKLPNSKVAGHANVLIFPDLNTGNNTYKAVQRSSGAIAIGPILQGLNKPVNDLSRGCKVEDIVNTVAITAIQASM
ncbi:MAG: phosphate acetyltransferase [Helicobacteraceae bacterium]|nr:phosphate acetyltransferase [Helicobacteraceae bacterium]